MPDIKCAAIQCDARPLMAYLKLLEHVLQGTLDLADLEGLNDRLARAETTHGPNGELVVRVLPSDDLLSFAASRYAHHWGYSFERIEVTP